jgi:hypothetical protein
MLVDFTALFKIFINKIPNLHEKLKLIKTGTSAMI